jgi:hypothetical protein
VLGSACSLLWVTHSAHRALATASALQCPATTVDSWFRCRSRQPGGTWARQHRRPPTAAAGVHLPLLSHPSCHKHQELQPSGVRTQRSKGFASPASSSLGSRVSTSPSDISRERNDGEDFQQANTGHFSGSFQMCCSRGQQKTVSIWHHAASIYTNRKYNITVCIPRTIWRWQGVAWSDTQPQHFMTDWTDSVSWRWVKNRMVNMSLRSGNSERH